MPQLWDSYVEFCNSVGPVLIDHDDPLRLAQPVTLCEQQAKISRALVELNEAQTKLDNLGLAEDPPQEHREHLDEAYGICLDLAYAGEDLLMYHRRLALSRAAYEFCHQKDIVVRENWDRYSATKRIFKEIARLVESVDEMVQGYRDMVTADSEYLRIDRDLPDNVEADFRLARDLLSVDLDAVGLLIAGRGLEGVLLQTAKNRTVTVEDKGKTIPASEFDFFQVIEVFKRLSWRGKGHPITDKPAVALLHYLRSLRNAGAHPVAGHGHTKGTAREMTKVTVDMAVSLWKESTAKGAQLVSTKVKRDW